MQHRGNIASANCEKIDVSMGIKLLMLVNKILCDRIANGEQYSACDGFGEKRMLVEYFLVCSEHLNELISRICSMLDSVLL